MKRFLAYLGVYVLVLALCWQVASAAVNTSWVINPGEGIGPIKMGMKFKQIEAMLTRDPKADQCYMRKKYPMWIYYNEGVQAGYDIKQNCIQVWADKPGIKTADKGIQVGDSAAAFKAAYGKNYLSHELPRPKAAPKQYYYAYKHLGLGFQVESEKIIFIAVFEKK